MELGVGDQVHCGVELIVGSEDKPEYIGSDIRSGTAIMVIGKRDDADWSLIASTCTTLRKNV